MALSGQMDDTVHMLILHQFIDCIKIANIHFDELIVRLIFNIFQIRQITCIGKLVKIDYLVLWIFIYKQADYVTSYEASATCDDYCLLHH